MNESDSQKWLAGETEIYTFCREVRNTSFSFTFSGTGIWLVILDNTKTMNIVENGHLTITLSDEIQLIRLTSETIPNELRLNGLSINLQVCLNGFS